MAGTPVITKFNCWRWISNPWGYIQKASVGALVKSTLSTEPLKLYLTTKPGDIAQNTPLTSYTYVGDLPKSSGFISQLYYGTSMPVAVAASSSTGPCGYWKVDTTANKENRLTLSGSTLDAGDFASRTSTDVRLDFLYPYIVGGETVGLYSTGLFTLLTQ